MQLAYVYYAPSLQRSQHELFFRMAERIDKFSPRRIGRPALYPWDEWTDGCAWRITRGSDFEIPTKSMVVNLHSTAARRGLSVSARVDGDAVEFQFTTGGQVAA